MLNDTPVDTEKQRDEHHDGATVLAAFVVDYQRPILAYGRPTSRTTAALLAVPISRRFAVLLFAIATWPFILSIPDPGSLFMRPLGHVLIGSATLGCAGIAFFVRLFLIHPLATTTSASEALARSRLRWTALTSIGFIALHASGLPLIVLFQLHRPLFDRAADRLEKSVPEWSGPVPHGRIGLFPITQASRGFGGNIAFSVGGDPIYRGGDMLFHPSGNGGSLGNGWRWEATD